MYAASPGGISVMCGSGVARFFGFGSGPWVVSRMSGGLPRFLLDSSRDLQVLHLGLR